MDFLSYGIVPNEGSHENYPLAQAQCRVSVVDVNVHASLAQTYICASSEAQDVTYVFPLPSAAAVCAFTAVIDNARTIKGVVKEKAEAQREYNEAVTKGKTAALLKQHTSQVFEASLGNLKPGQTVVVNIEFVMIIPHAGETDTLWLRCPVSVAPFYGTPPESLKSHVNPALPPFELSASFQMHGRITSITSGTHPIAVNLGSVDENQAVNFNPMEARVTITSDDMLCSDIVLEVKCEGLDQPRCSVQRFVPRGDTDLVIDAVSLSLVPRFNPEPIPVQEYIFLVDRSGSMEGGRIRAVRAALQIMLRSLPSRGTTFNIFSFGDICDSLWPASVEYSKDSVDEAMRHVDRMHADYGGTEIASALFMAAKSRKAHAKQPAALFVVTDGKVWDVHHVFKTVAAAVEESDNALRTFVLGVGDQVSTEMCDSIASAGRGVATYVREKEKPDAKLVGLLKAARSALVKDVTIDWGVPPDAEQDFEMIDADDEPGETAPPSAAKVDPISLFSGSVPSTTDVALGPEDINVVLPPPPILQQAPTQLDKLPPMYAGFRTNIFALIRRPRDAPLPAKVFVKGTMVATPVTLDVPVISARTMEHDEDRVPFIHVLAARALVQSLEDDSARTGAPMDALTKAKIVRLGTTFGIASSQTSFIAVDESGDVVPRRNYTSAAVKEIVHSNQHRASSTRASDIKREVTKLTTFHANLVSDGDDDDDDDEDMGFALYDDVGATVNCSMTPASAYTDSDGPAEPNILAAIALAQQFDGSFPSLAALGLKAPPPPPPPGFSGAAETWKTVVALAFLQARFGEPEEREVWSFIGDKARDFVLGSVVDAMGVSQETAEGLLEGWIAYAVKQLPP